MKKSIRLILSIIILLFVILGVVLSINIYRNNHSINIYTGLEEEYVEQYIKEFSKDYPDIKVNIIRDSTGVVSSKLMVEKDNPRADVVWGINSSNIVFLDNYGLFAPYLPKNLSEFDKRFYDTKNPTPHWMGISLATVAFTVNIKELEKRNLPIPESFEDLSKPEYKDEIIMPNPVSSGTGYSCISALMQIYGEENAWKYLDKLNKNISQYSHSGSAPTKQTAQGEYLIGIGMDFLSMQMEKSNPQIKTVFPKEGSGWDVEISALVNKKYIKDEAKIFYDWSLSEKAMKLYAKNRSLVTMKDEKFQNPEFKDSINKMIDNDLNWSSSNRKSIVDKWEKNYGVGEQ